MPVQTLRNSGPGPNRRLLLLLLLFVVSRLFVLAVDQPASDVGIYSDYVQEYLAAAEQGRSFYDLHAEKVDAESADVRRQLRAGAAPAEARSVEYPPLAVAAMHLPRLWMSGAGQPGSPPSDFLRAYRRAYRAGLAVLDVLLFALVIGLVQRLFARDTGWGRRQRLLAYVLSTIAVWYLLYDRLDLVLALLVVLSLALLCSRFHLVWSFAVLAVAINFKLVPLVLAPIWVVGALPAGSATTASRLWLRLGTRAALLVALVSVAFLPFYLVSGPAVLGFLSYHGSRGIEFESLYGSLLLALQKWSGPVGIAYVYKSVCVTSPLASLLARLAPGLTLLLLFPAIGLVLVQGRRLAAASPEETRTKRLAQLGPQRFFAYTLLFLMVVVLTSKVFSPQYLLWIAPLVPLVPLAGRARSLFLWGFVTLCILSTVAFPFLFTFDMADRTPELSLSLWTFRSPTPRLIAILVMRNLLFAALTAGLALSLWGRCRQERA